MILPALIGALTFVAIGPGATAHHGANAQVRAPQIIEIRADMISTNQANRLQLRFSSSTRGSVVAISNAHGSIQWASSDREKLGGQDAPAMIYIQMFDGIFAIDPFTPLPAGNDSTAQMLFRGTTLQTDRTVHHRSYMDRTAELLTKLEQARHTWLRDNGFYGVRVFTNENASAQDQAQAKANGLPKPAAVFERPVDVPRIKSREQVKGDDQRSMAGAVAMLTNDDEPIRISLPHNMASDVVARIEKRNKAQEQAQEQNAQVALED